MAVTFILGRAGSGKTHRCLDALVRALSEPDSEQRLLWLVPEQTSLQLERLLALRAPRGGFSRAEVLSFSRLAHRVLGELGRDPVTLRAAARKLVLRHLAAGEDDVRHAFGGALRSAGFFDQLERLLAELLSEDVSPQEISAAVARLPAGSGTHRRALGVARIHQAYLDWLGAERIDPHQRLGLAREGLREVAWIRGTRIWIDGFAGFTGQETALLVELARLADEVHIALLADPASPGVTSPTHPPDLLSLFHRTESTYQQLRARLDAAGVEITPPVYLRPERNPRFGGVPELGALEQEYATPIGVAREVGAASARNVAPRHEPAAEPVVSVLRRRDPPAAPERELRSPPVAPIAGVRILECESHRAELQQAARLIRRQVLGTGGRLRYRDFALIVRDLEPFAALVADVFAEYDIPFFLDRRRSLATHALPRFLGALFEVLDTRLAPRAARRWLRTGLLPLTIEQAELLDNVIATYEPAGYARWLRTEWPQCARQALDATARAALDAQRVHIAQCLEPLGAACDANEPPTARGWAELLHAALERLDVPRTLESWSAAARERGALEAAEVHRLAWDAVCEVLEDLHGVLADARLTLHELAEIVNGALRETTLGIAPPALDQVLIGSIERSRHPDIRHAWLFAFNDGIFPRRAADDALLSTIDRQRLAEAGLPAPKTRRDAGFDERMLAYVALTRASEGLTISYAKVGLDGEPVGPSPFLREIRGVLPQVSIAFPEADAPPVSVKELARGYLDARSDREREPARFARHKTLRSRVRRISDLARRFEACLFGESYENAVAPVLREGRGSDPGVTWSGSPSEIESYLNCPFKHFATYTLALQPPPGSRALALDLGSLAHECLADVTRRALHCATPIPHMTDEQWLTLLELSLRERVARAADTLPTAPRPAFLLKTLEGMLREVLLAHAARWRCGMFTPLACEQNFDLAGTRESIRALELELPDGRTLRLHGFIDRIDIATAAGRTWLLVYDYKSSPQSLKPPYLIGTRLQLLTYLCALRQAFATPEYAPAGVFLAPLYPDTAVVGNVGFEDLSDAEARMRLFRPRGVFDQEIAALLDADAAAGDSPVAAMRRKKDGGFYQTADARPRGELDARTELAAETVRVAAEGLIAGRIDVAPLIENRTPACTRCDFREVCRFDPIFNRPRDARVVLPHLSMTETNAGDTKAEEDA